MSTGHTNAVTLEPPALTAAHSLADATIAGGGFHPTWDDGVPATAATLNGPDGVAVDHGGNVFIADTENNKVRRVDPDESIADVAGSTFGGAGFAGDGGAATEALLDHPTGVAVNRRGELFIADENNHRILRVGLHGKITTIAGSGRTGWEGGGYAGDDGPAIEALLHFPTEVLVDGAENLVIADSTNLRVRSVNRDAVITTIAGGGTERPADGLPATSVYLEGAPTGMALDRADNLVVCEEYGHRIWRLTRKTRPATG
jgi:trimeric autotransporter adhesin